MVCNSNCAVDAVAEKVTEKNPSFSSAILRTGGAAAASGISIASAVRDKIVRTGYRQKVSKAVQPWFMDSLENAVSLVKSNVSKSVLFTTLHAASGHTLKGGDEFTKETFDTLVVDEAGQIEDTKLFILIKRMSSLKKVILIGDHKQLQPYVSENVRKQGYGVSTMERMLDGWKRSGIMILAPEQVRSPVCTHVLPIDLTPSQLTMRYDTSCSRC